MSDAPELKPCPFCGGEASYSEQERLNSDAALQYIEVISCDDCMAEVNTFFHDDTFAAWNTRTDTIGWQPIEWERQEGATYAWALGLHYYSEQDEDGMWPTNMMIGDQSVWDGITYESREDAEAHMQADYEIRLNGAVLPKPPE